MLSIFDLRLALWVCSQKHSKEACAETLTTNFLVSMLVSLSMAFLLIGSLCVASWHYLKELVVYEYQRLPSATSPVK
jgi:hypothetical protein